MPAPCFFKVVIENTEAQRKLDIWIRFSIPCMRMHTLFNYSRGLAKGTSAGLSEKRMLVVIVINYITTFAHILGFGRDGY